MGSVEELASFFEQIADLDEIKGELRFKVLAYRRAAEAIRSIGESILSLEEIKELRRFPGVGEGIAKKISEYNRTGTITRLEELKDEMPIELVALLKIPNLGPRRARLLYDELGVRSVVDLEEAAETHKVAGLKGLGPKAEQNILEGIKLLRSHTGRLLLPQAYQVSAEILEGLREALPGITAERAGSLRRMKDTVGDIDILATWPDPKKLMDVFCSLQAVERVIARGDTKSSILTREAVQVDLRVVDENEWGAALQYFTGSQPHNVHLREIAKKQGLKVNEYGVFSVKTGEKLTGADEEEVYHALGLQWPPPELRENRGELEAALDGMLPCLVARADIAGDLHLHTEATDGYASLEDLRRTATGLGYGWLGITDHAANLKIARGLERTRLLTQREEIRALNRKAGPHLLAGSELNIGNEGEVDYDEELLAQLDFTIASVHGGFRQERAQLTRRVLRAMENPRVRIIGHPTGRVIGQRPAFDIDMDAVLRKAAETGTALELNSFPDRLDLNDEYLLRAKRLGVKIALGSDAHRAEHMEYMFYGVATARRGWLEKDDILNTMSLRQLQQWLQHPKGPCR